LLGPAHLRIVPDALTEAFEFLAERGKRRLDAANCYVDAYRHYCWPVQSVSDLKLAPFHLLATKGQVYVQKDHVWHMEKLGELCKASDGLLLATPYKQVDVTDTITIEEAARWWEKLTARGGEGMVVDFIARGRRGLTQPAVKCRGPEYLRIIYGPEYLVPQNLERLRSRSTSAKRSLALSEFALGIEALERFVRAKKDRARIFVEGTCQYSIVIGGERCPRRKNSAKP
jgi:protein phosphatase